MTKFILLALGGAMGAPLRYLMNDLMKHSYFFMMPSGIMLVNFLGCFCMGIAMAQISDLRSNIYFCLIIDFSDLSQRCQLSRSKQLKCFIMARG